MLDIIEIKQDLEVLKLHNPFYELFHSLSAVGRAYLVDYKLEELFSFM